MAKLSEIAGVRRNHHVSGRSSHSYAIYKDSKYHQSWKRTSKTVSRMDEFDYEELYWLTVCSDASLLVASRCNDQTMGGRTAHLGRRDETDRPIRGDGRGKMTESVAACSAK